MWKKEAGRHEPRGSRKGAGSRGRCRGRACACSTLILYVHLPLGRRDRLPLGQWGYRLMPRVAIQTGLAEDY